MWKGGWGTGTCPMSICSVMGRSFVGPGISRLSSRNLDTTILLSHRLMLKAVLSRPARRTATLVPRATFASTKALFALADSPLVTRWIRFNTKGVLSLPVDPLDSASCIAWVMIASILLLAMEYSAGIGLAKNTPEPRGNPFWAPMSYI